MSKPVAVYKPWGAFWKVYSRHKGEDTLLGMYVTLLDACKRGAELYA